MQDFGNLIIVLFQIVLLAIVLERAMIVLFEWRWYENLLGGLGLKVPITYGVALIICATNSFEVFTPIFEPGTSLKAVEGDPWSNISVYLTAAVIAGGSAGAISLFQGVLKMTKAAQKDAGLLQTKAGGGGAGRAGKSGKKR